MTSENFLMETGHQRSRCSCHQGDILEKEKRESIEKRDQKKKRGKRKKRDGYK